MRKITSEQAIKALDKFKGAKVTLTKYYSIARQLSGTMETGFKDTSKVSGEFYAAKIMLKNGDCIAIGFPARTCTNKATINELGRDNILQAWFKFVYDGIQFSLHLENEEPRPRALEAHRFEVSVQWSPIGPEFEHIIFPEKAVSFIDGMTGKAIPFGVNANLWGRRDVPSCYEILKAWPKRIG